jgi:hypothetical protein
MGGKMKMANAIKAVRSEEIRLKKTSKVFEIPRSTLKNYVNSKETDTGKLISTRLGRKPVLPYNLEEEIASFCQMVDREFFGLVTKTIKKWHFNSQLKWLFSSIFSTTRKNRLEVAA